MNLLDICGAAGIIGAVMQTGFSGQIGLAKFRPGLRLGAAAGLGLLLAVSACAESEMDDVRVMATEPARFDYLFTGASRSADGQTLLAFNHRSGRTWFVAPGEKMDAYRVAGYEIVTNKVEMPALNTTVDEVAGKAILIGPDNEKIILEQNRPLPRPGRVAWLVRLNQGLWWNVQEQSVFFMGATPVCVEEIDEDGVTVTAGDKLVFVRRMTAGEKDGLNRLWADQKLQEQQREEMARRQREVEAVRALDPAGESNPIVYYTPATPRGPNGFFYGNEIRYPSAFAVYPTLSYVRGRPVVSYVVVPTAFTTRYTGISIMSE
jgi:hypothetical protein